MIGALSRRPISHYLPCKETPMIYDSILDTIGNTPIVKLHRLAPKHVSV